MTPYILAFQAIVWLLITWLFLRSRRASIFHPFGFYLVFHGVVFVIRPIMEYVFSFEQVFFYMRFYPNEDQVQEALFLTTAALVVFACASWVVETPRPHWGRPVTDGFTAHQWRAFALTSTLLAAPILYSSWIAISDSLETAGADANVQMERDVDTGIMTFTNTTGYLVDAEKLAGALLLMLIWGARFRLWSLVPLALYLMERAYEGWSRWTIVLPLISLALLYAARSGRRWLTASAVIVALPLYLIFQQLGENREAIKAIVFGQPTPVVDSRSWIERQDNLDFANFDYLTYVMDVVPEKSGTFTYFTQYLQLFTEPIPRVLWPEKPIGPPIQLVNLNNYGNFTGLTVSIVGDGWMSGGWLGVILTMAIVGGMVSGLHRWCWRAQPSAFRVLLYCAFLPLTLQWYRDGGISIAKFALFTMVPILLWQAIANYFGAIPARAHAARGASRDKAAALPRTD